MPFAEHHQEGGWQPTIVYHNDLDNAAPQEFSYTPGRCAENHSIGGLRFSVGGFEDRIGPVGRAPPLGGGSYPVSMAT